MRDDTLTSYVLALADADESLSEPARLAVLAALEDPDVLSEALGGASADLANSLTAQADESPRGTINELDSDLSLQREYV